MPPKGWRKHMQGETPESTPESNDNALSQILGALSQLSDRIAAIETKQPQFRPMERPKRAPTGERYVPQGEVLARAMKGLTRDGESAAGQASIYDDPARNANLPADLRPAFRPTELVRLNLDAKVYGGDKTWREVLQWTDAEEPVGEVLGMVGRMRNYEPKYRVRFRGVTQRNSGFREHELLPAY